MNSVHAFNTLCRKKSKKKNTNHNDMMPLEFIFVDEVF